MSYRTASRALPLLLVLAACADPAEEPCVGAACGGGGGAGGGEPCVDHTAESSCRDDDFDDPCGREVCTLASRQCPNGERCCVLRLSCEPAVGLTAGGKVCGSDEECASGLCLEIAGVKSCFRACSAAGAPGGCPDGQHCVTVGLGGGATTRSCVGGTAEAPDPQATVCTRPGECPEGRDCRLVNGEAIMEGLATALCLPRVEPDWFDRCAPEPGSFGGYHGQLGSPACASGGLCFDGCRNFDSYACYCEDAQLGEGTCRGFRCTGVCGRDEDCPDRAICQGIPGAIFDFRDPLLEFALCRLPYGEPLDWACWDELDCCTAGLRANGTPCCRTEQDGTACVEPAFPAETTHCRFLPSGGRYLTRCAPPEGRLPVGAPCADHAACESGLCASDGAAGQVCVSPCDLAFDRCADIVDGTTCCPTPVEVEGESHCVPGCRTSCASPAECAP